MTLRRVSFFDGFQSETTPVTVVIADREFRVGSGVPSASLGNDTDNYLDYDTGNIYLKTSGTWSQIGAINLLSVAQDFTVNGTLFATNNVDATNAVIAGTSISSGTDLIAGGNLDINGTGESNIAGNLTVEGNFTVNGTTTTVNTDILDVEDANITVNVGGDQASADLNDAGLTVQMSDVTNALIHYDSTAATRWKIGEEGSTVEIADISTTQTLTNKTIDLDNNTVSNIELDNFKSGIVETDISGVTDDTKIATSQAIKNFVLSQSGFAYSNITSAYSITSNDVNLRVDSTSASFNITLPDATLVTTGKPYFIFKKGTDTNIVTINTTSSQTIDGDLTLDLRTENDYVLLVNNGSNWDLVDKNITVSASYSTNAGQAIAGEVTVLFEDEDYDTHDSYNTSNGEYTVPFKGKYQINAGIRAIVTSNENESLVLRIKINGVTKFLKNHSNERLGFTSVDKSCTASHTLNLEENDIITITAQFATSDTLAPFNDVNYFSITKIGN